MSVKEKIQHFKQQLPSSVQLIAVSKTKPIEAIQEAYDAGQRIFGENKAQEMASKYEQLPKDIEWHMIGHMQRNKVRYIAPFVSLIHSVDSERLLEEINKRAAQNQRKIPCLLQVYIANEETKFGFDPEELMALNYQELSTIYPHIIFKGLMGMATNTDNTAQVKSEFLQLAQLFEKRKSEFPDFEILSIGMSSDYQQAIEAGSTHVRIGSAVFGARNI